MKSGQKVTWDCVYFGNYPQTEVVLSGSEEETALKEMNACYETKYEVIEDADIWAEITDDSAYDENGDSKGKIDNYYYRRILKSDATSTYDSTQYTWLDNTSYHYFRYEPIKWRVLNVDNDKAFLLSDVALDCQKYHTDYEDVTWETSTIRSWLNGYADTENIGGEDYSSDNFINNAFSADERVAIETATVKNANNIEYETAGGENTKDNVFLLSEAECWGDKAFSYGFVNNSSTYDEGRRSQTSTYAYAMGTYRNYNIDEGKNYIYAGNCYWLLRSPGKSSGTVALVYYYGNGVCNGYVVNLNVEGVRPVLYLDLSYSDLYTYAGTVCSDEVLTSGGSGSNTDSGNSTGGTGGSGNPADTTESGGGTGGTGSIVGGAGSSGSGSDTKVSSIKITVKGQKAKAAKKITVKAGKKLKLKGTTTLAGVSLKWKSSNKKYATVNKKGVVKTKKAGKGKTVKITATATDGSGVKATVKIKIK